MWSILTTAKQPIDLHDRSINQHIIVQNAEILRMLIRQEEVTEQEREAEMRDTEMMLADRIRKVSIDPFLLDLIDRIRKVEIFKLL